MIDHALGPRAAAMPSEDRPHIGEPYTAILELVRVMQTLRHSRELAGLLHVDTPAVVAHVSDNLIAMLRSRLDSCRRSLLTALASRFVITLIEQRSIPGDDR